MENRCNDETILFNMCVSVRYIYKKGAIVPKSEAGYSMHRLERLKTQLIFQEGIPPLADVLSL